MKEHTREDPKIIAAAERQMQTWAKTAELKDRALREDVEHPATQRTFQYLTISREVGAGGGQIGQCLGQRLGWDVFDKNLLDQVADRFNLCRSMLDLVDETRSNWVYDVLGTWMDRKIVTHGKYFSRLCRVVSRIARHGQAVFIGRGAQFLLPRPQTFAVRVVASPAYRLRQIIERTGMKEDDARRHMLEVDQGRREFVERFFHRDITDPHHYNLVINVEQCGQQCAVEEILAALGR